MRRMNTFRRTCRWQVCRACQGIGYRDGGALAWDLYFLIHDQLSAAEDRVCAAYKAGTATTADVQFAMEQLITHLQATPEPDCRACFGVGSLRGRAARSRRRGRGRRP